jgi:hypothetical protein
MEFDNWLMTVEAPGLPRDARDGRPENKDLSGGDLTSKNDEQVPEFKRRRSHSPTTQRAGGTSDLAPHEQHGASLSLRPSPKRSLSAASSTGRKRLKFSDSVEFHDDYRSSEQYHRPSETYVRGRNAPPEGYEYMDTSGSGLTFLKFTGMKKVGTKWVELSGEELAKQSEKAKTLAELRKLVTAEKSNAEPADGDPVDEVSQNEGAPPNARAARLARRTKGASSAESAQTRGTTSRQGQETSREGKQLQLDSALDGGEERSVSPTLALVATITHDDHHQSVGSLGRVEIIGDNGLERRSDAVPETATTAAMCADRVQHAVKPHDEPHMDTQVTSEAECQVNAVQPHTSTAEPQPTVLSGHGLLQTGPTEESSRKGHDAAETGIQETSPNSLGLQPTLTNHDDSKTASTKSFGQSPGARRVACETPVQKGDIVGNDMRLAAQTTPNYLEKAVAMGTPLQEPSAGQECSVTDSNRLSSPDDEPQVQQGHLNAAIASVTKLQDPDRHPAAKTSTAEEAQILAGGGIEEAENTLSQNLA